MDSPFFVEDWTLIDVRKAMKPFYKKWSDEKYDRLLAEFSLIPTKKVKELSRGMRMKLTIACALSHDADLLILDEPTSGLDAVARDELMEILQSFTSDENKAILFSTHITADLEKIADYVTFINGGRILHSDTKDNLLNKYVVVKGGLNILNDAQRGLVIGYRESKVNFEGIAPKENLKEFPKEIITEPCNLDEIVVRFNLQGGCKK
jgi:ABC-2 type transport system ATP-binding protein